MAIPPGVDPDQPPTAHRLHDPALAQTLLTHAGSDGPMWLAEAVVCTPAGSCDAVETAVRDHFRVLEGRRFFQERLELIAPRH